MARGKRVIMEKKATWIEKEITELELMYEFIKPNQEVEFRRRWCRLPETGRRELVDRLLKKGLLPPQTELVLKIFNGKIVSLL